MSGDRETVRSVWNEMRTAFQEGHAMRADGPAAGTIVGKALEPLAEGQDRIEILVMLR